MIPKTVMYQNASHLVTANVDGARYEVRAKKNPARVLEFFAYTQPMAFEMAVDYADQCEEDL